MDSGQGQSLVGMAKRWLKLQVQFHGDPHRARRDREEAEAIKGEMEDRVREDVGRAVVTSLMPPSWKRKLDELEQAKANRTVEEERRRRAEHEARPRADVRLRLTGDVEGEIEAAIPVTMHVPEAEGEALAVELEPLDPIAVGGHSLLGFQFAAPGFTGPGTYDIGVWLERQGIEDWDALLTQLWLDSTDEPFYWVPEYGLAMVEVAEDGRVFRVSMPMEDAGGRKVRVEAAIWSS